MERHGVCPNQRHVTGGPVTTYEAGAGSVAVEHLDDGTAARGAIVIADVALGGMGSRCIDYQQLTPLLT